MHVIVNTNIDALVIIAYELFRPINLHPAELNVLRGCECPEIPYLSGP